MPRQIQTPVKKESRKEKRAAREEWAQNRSSVPSVVLPTILAFAGLILMVIFYGTRAKVVIAENETPDL